MSGTVCCYVGCKKSYSTDKDISFFKFPDDPKRRKKWMQNSGNVALESLPERQLRGKRICSDHFTDKSFKRAESKSALNDSAVPIVAKTVKVEPPPSPAAGRLSKGKREEKETKQSTKPELTKRKREEKETTKQSTKPELTAEAEEKSTSEISTEKSPVTPSKNETEPPKKSAKSSQRAESKSVLNDSPVPIVANTVNVEPPPSPVAGRLSKRKREEKETKQSTKPELTAEEKSTSETSTEKSPVTPSKNETEPPKKSAKSSQRAEPKSALNDSAMPIVAKTANVEPPPSPAAGRLSKRKREEKEAKQSTKPELTAEAEEKSTSEISTVKSPVTPSKNETEPPKKSAKSSQRAEPKSALNDSAVPIVAKTVNVEPPPSPVAGRLSKGKGEKKETKQSTKPQLTKRKREEKETTKQSTKPESTKRKREEKDAKQSTKPELTAKEKSTSEISTEKAPVTPSNNEIELPKKSAKSSQKVEITITGNLSEADSYDEYMYFDRDFEEAAYDDDPDGRLDREFERFYASLKKFLHLSGKWTMGGVQWDPQGRRKVIIISEPDIPPNGRPCVKRCLQFFEDKAIRVFIDGMDMTDVFGMSCYAEKEDVAALICRVAEASSCCGVPEMVLDDLAHFPYARKRNTSYFDSDCPGVIPNDSYDPMCSSCKQLQELVMECRKKEKQRLMERRIRSQEKDFQHPFGKALYTMFNDLVDETDPTKPKKKRTKETFFRKYLHDTRYKVDGDSSKTERVYIEKPISVDSVSASFQDIVSKLGFNMPNAKRPKTYTSGLSRPPSMSLTSTPKPYRMMTPGSSNMGKGDRKQLQVEQIMPFSTGSSFTLGDGQEYEVIGEVEPGATEMVEMKHAPSQPQYEIIEVDDETLAKLASAKNQVVVLPDAAAASSNLQVTRIDANDPNLSQILKAINTSHSYKVN